jgi:hypothetical protein
VHSDTCRRTAGRTSAPGEGDIPETDPARIVTTAPTLEERIGTRDPQIHSLKTARPNTFSDQASGADPITGCSAGCSEPLDLTRVRAAWPNLPDPIKAAILALVGPYSPTDSGGTA